MEKEHRNNFHNNQINSSWTRNENISLYCSITIAITALIFLIISIYEISIQGSQLVAEDIIGLSADILTLIGFLFVVPRFVFHKRRERLNIEEELFHILEPLENHLRKFSEISPRSLRQCGPIWSDFESGFVYKRAEVDSLRESIDCSPIVLLIGKSGTGKTTMCHLVA